MSLPNIVTGNTTSICLKIKNICKNILSSLVKVSGISMEDMPMYSTIGPFVVLYFNNDNKFRKFCTLSRSYVNTKKNTLSRDIIDVHFDVKESNFIPSSSSSSSGQKTSKKSSSKKTRKEQEQEIAVSRDLENNTPFLLYPPHEGATGQLRVTVGDLQRLEDTQFLNDTLIDLYFR